uniref:Uncharacterized protein n=1 Tax=Cucumis melo TaxID=3656 RepID=A0A9I9DKN3_CUCME
MAAELSMPEYVEHSRRLLVMKNPDSLLEKVTTTIQKSIILQLRRTRRGMGISNNSDSILDYGMEKLRSSKVRKEEFVHLEKIDGKLKNVVQGLEIHAGVLNDE